MTTLSKAAKWLGLGLVAAVGGAVLGIPPIATALCVFGAFVVWEADSKGNECV